MQLPLPFSSLERVLGVAFREKNLLKQALTHRSSVMERRQHGHNERLEFLGDAVLQLLVTEHLYRASDKAEGELTNWRSALVQGDSLAEVANEWKLGEYLFLSRGEEASGGREKPSTLADAVEAIIGALYIDQGMEAVRAIVEKFIFPRLPDLIAVGRHKDLKSLFQEIAQEKTGITPTYTTIGEAGPDHKKLFTCAVAIGAEQIALGKGGTKQKAEQDAAKAALLAKGWR